MKLAHMRTTPGKEDRESPLLLRIRVTSLKNRKLTASQIRAHLNAIQSSSSRHISTSTVPWKLHKSGLYGQIAVKKNPTKEKEQAEEICLGLETQGIDFRPVESALV